MLVDTGFGAQGAVGDSELQMSKKGGVAEEERAGECEFASKATGSSCSSHDDVNREHDICRRGRREPEIGENQIVSTRQRSAYHACS